MRTFLATTAAAILGATVIATPAVAGGMYKASASGEQTASMAIGPDIVDTAVDAGSFKTLVSAVQAAGLVETLKGPGPFTVFAPTDAAFGQLGTDALADLLMPENRDKLTAILTYHVLPGAVTSDQIAGKDLAVDTVNGAKLDIDATDGVMVGEARVVQADIKTSNGVIHVIDKVLVPQM